jgi:site-specific recombinase XerD
MPQHHHLSTPIDEAFTIFRLHCKAQRYRQKSIEFYDNLLPPFFKWLIGQGVSQIEAITAHHVRAHLVNKQTIYVGTEDESEASGHTIHAIARALRAFFNFCVAETWLTVSPMATVKMPRKPKKILAAYAATEIKKLFAAAKDDREKTLLYILLDTGIRAGECVSLRARSVDWQTNSLTIIAGKGEKDRMVYFGAKTARYLIRYMRGMEPAQYLFTNHYTGSQFTYNGLAQLLRRIGKAANVHCTAHKFRRTFAINSLRNGMNLYYLARLMGHEDIAILKPYLDIVKVDLQTAYQQFGVVDNL